MLTIAESLRELRFSDLMDVYIEGNIANGAERYPNESLNQQLALAEQDFYLYLKEVFFAQEQAVYALWECEKRYATALRLEPFTDGLLLTALETRPDARRNGYAMSLIHAVVRYLSGKGSGVLYSHVSKSNHASLILHEKCGFTRIKEYAIYLDGSVMQNSYTLQLKY